MVPTVIIPSMNPILRDKALSYLPKEWPYIVKDGNPRKHFDELKGLDIKTKWAINLDEDCFLMDAPEVLNLIEWMEQEGFDMAGIQDGSSHMRQNNPVLFNPFFFVFDVQKLQAVEKKCLDVVSESQKYDHLVKYRHLPYQYEKNIEDYYPFFVDLLHAGMRPLFLDSLPYKDFPEDGTIIAEPSILLSPKGTEIAIHSWYSRHYHEPVIQQRIQICENYALSNPNCYQNRPADVGEISALISSIKPRTSPRPFIRLGGPFDGGYLIPDDLDGIKECFSPGVSDNASFELDLLELGIESHLADYSVEAPPLGLRAKSFCKKFLGAVNNDVYMTLDKWVLDRQDQTQSDDLILQMDIEGGEYDTLSACSREVLKKFRIITLEVHHVERWTRAAFFEVVKPVFDKLLLDFNVVHNHPNNWCGVVDLGGIMAPRVFEITLLRKDRGDTKGPIDSMPHALDRPNIPWVPDVVLPREWY